jgi:hypothetical protein
MAPRPDLDAVPNPDHARPAWSTTHVSRPLAARRWRGFRGHLLVFVLVGAFLVVVRSVIDVHGFFWLVFLVAGWGIGGDESLQRLLAAAAHRASHPPRPGVRTSRTGQRRRASGSCLRVWRDPAQHRACAGGGAREMEELV